MGRKKSKYQDELCHKMYLYFLNYNDRGLPSFTKFAISMGLTTKDIEGFRRHRRFESAYRECREIRRDYLIDRALDKRFDGSFVKFLMSCEDENQSSDGAGDITMHLKVTD